MKLFKFKCPLNLVFTVSESNRPECPFTKISDINKKDIHSDLHIFFSIMWPYFVLYLLYTVECKEKKLNNNLLLFVKISFS